VTDVNEELTAGQGFVFELIFTYILVLSILGVTDQNRPKFGSPAVEIGLTIATVHLAAVSLNVCFMLWVILN